MKKIILLLTISIIISVVASAQQKRLYIAIDDHTDYMWTADEATYDSAFVHMLDYYLGQIDSTKNNAADFQCRFNCDGNLWLKAYQKHRSPQQFQKLVAAIKSGHISAPLNMLVSCYGAQPTEAVIRGMYYPGSLERRYGLRFSMAGAMENNTLPLGLASLWAGSGAKYTWKGIGGYGSQMSYAMRAKRKFPVYQYKGLDGSGVLMKWYPYNEKKDAPLGGYAECRAKIKYKDLVAETGYIIHLLDKQCDTVSATSAYPYNIAAAFGFGHDDLETYVSAPFITAAQKATTQQRKVRVSNEEDFFVDFSKTYPKVPAQSVSYGNEWDLLCATMNETTARVRRSTEKLRSAEALAAVVSLRQPHFADDLLGLRSQAWQAFGVYWEHKWTADGPVPRKSRAAWQMRTQADLSAYVDSLYNRSAAVLARQLTTGKTLSFYVFNPLSWARTDLADVMYNGPLPVAVVDAERGQEAASQIIQKDGQQYIRILAESIPSVGYKIYQIHQRQPAVFESAIHVTNAGISNAFYSVDVSASGAITRIYDKRASREVVQTIDGKFCNDLGGPVADGDSLVVENSGPVSVTLKAVSHKPVLHTSRVTLFATANRIEIEDSIQQNFGDIKTWAFSFNLRKPTTHHEELGAVLTVKKKSSGGDYADENARYDWQTLNHFADVSEAAYGVTLSNLDCSFFKLGKSTLDSLCDNASQLSALAGGNIDKKVEDGGTLGILNQNGATGFLYHFAIIPHASSFDAVQSMKAALEHQNPLVATLITGSSSTPTANRFSLLSVNNPAVLVWSVKPSEEGINNGLITRLWNMGSGAVSTALHPAKPIKTAWRTTHIETNRERLKPIKGALALHLAPLQLTTYRLMFATK